MTTISMSNEIEKLESDVLVIGGGPSGLFTAKLLSGSGLKTILVEKDSEIGRGVVCSGVISKEAFQRYALPENAVVGRIQNAELYAPDGSHLPYNHPEEAVYVVDRHIFDGELAKEAGRAGAQILLNAKVTNLQVTEGGVQATLKTPGGEKEVNSALTVIATGVSYNLQSSLGMGRPEKISKGIQVEVIARDVDRLRIYWSSQVSEGFFGWAIPLSDGRTRVGVMTEGDAATGLKNILARIGPYTNICTDIGRVKRRGIAYGAIPRSYSNRVIAVGEAAGLVKTTTGGGIYYGLISAELASGVILEAFQRQDYSAKSLSKYEKLWRSGIGREIKYGKYFHKFYSRLGDKSLDALFDAAQKDGLLPYISQNGKFDWHQNAVIKILRSPNLRKVLLWEGINQARTNVALWS